MITHSQNETISLGEKLGKLLNKGNTICLKGDLAGGKTTFTKGIGIALGVKEIINSPTFTILKIYNGKDITLYHIDAYRLEKSNYDLGMDEFEEDGIKRKLSKRKDPEAAVSYYDKKGIPVEAVKLYLMTIANSNFEAWIKRGVASKRWRYWSKR